MPVTLITPTGGRPYAFSLCCKWVERMVTHYGKEVQWIVTDDVYPPTEIPSWAEVLRIKPYWKPKQPNQDADNTQARNMLSALSITAGDKIVVIEDDDWYREDYLSLMVSRLESSGKSLVGCIPARYYHIPERTWMVCPNRIHASLCCTAFRSEVVPSLRRLCQQKEKWLDVSLFRVFRSFSALFPEDHPSCIGVKGLPGRPGIGIGHQARAYGYRKDPDLSLLRQWIGNDLQYYYGDGYANTAELRDLHRTRGTIEVPVPPVLI